MLLNIDELESDAEREGKADFGGECILARWSFFIPRGNHSDFRASGDGLWFFIIVEESCTIFPNWVIPTRSPRRAAACVCREFFSEKTLLSDFQRDIPPNFQYGNSFSVEFLTFGERMGIVREEKENFQERLCNRSVLGTPCTKMNYGPISRSAIMVLYGVLILLFILCLFPSRDLI